MTIMEKAKRDIAKLLIVLISFFCIDGGRSIMLITDKIQIIVNQNHINDIDIPHQHHLVSLNEEEKWLESFSLVFFCFNSSPEKFYFYLNTSSQEYSDSIWQPPKFV